MSYQLDNPTRIAGLAIVVLAWALPTLGQTADADLYRAGLRSFESGYWREALVFFTAAAQEEPQEGQTVREYGMWQAPYLPHYYQGLALYQLGHYAEALKALETSEAQGAIKARRSKKYYKKLVASKVAIRRQIFQQVGQLYRSAAADYETAEQLQESPLVASSNLPDAIPAYSAITASLEKTTADLEDASLLAAASELGRALSLLDQARDGIAEMAQEIRRRELETIVEQNRIADEQRAAQQKLDLELAKTLMASGQCRPQAIELLENGAETSLQAPALLLSRAHLQCDQLALAAYYLTIAEAHDEPGWQALKQELTARRQDAARQSASHATTAESALAAVKPTLTSPEERAALEEKLAHLQQQQRARKIREQAIEDYLAARAQTELGECRDQEVSNLIENAERALGDATNRPAGTTSSEATLSRSGDPLPVPYQPHLVLARAYSRCRDRDRVERYLELANGSGEASAGELAELESWLADHPKLEPYTGSFALLVGASDYGRSQGWPTLYQPGVDIEEVRRILESHGFQVEMLEDPTGSELEATLNQFFLRYGATASHRLVFYYAGHGHTEITRHGVKLGYLVPVDARDPQHDRTHLQDLFGMERFREYAIRSDANDILFMFDSCFAGTVFEATKSCAPPLCVPPALGESSLTELVSRPVRMFLTAGDESERVPDDSLFRRMVARALAGEADHDNDGFILGRELANFVQSGVISQQNEAIARYKTAALGPAPAEPKWGTLIEGNFGRGDLMFDVPESARKKQPTHRNTLDVSSPIELAYWSAARQADAPPDYRRYLERFPEGVFAPLAEWILERP